jgi:methionine synthase II (cobalamin-independent)
LPPGQAAGIFAAAMRVLLANHSSYPGVPGASDLTRVLGEQVAAGLDLVTDGQLGWDDAIAPVTARIDGVRCGALTTLPGLADAFRQPIVQAKLRRHRALYLDAYRGAAALTQARLKAVLTGPYTLAHCAALATTAYRSADDLADDLSAILAQEVGALIAAGAAAIQIDEPLILAHPRDIRRVRLLLEPLYDAAGGRAPVMVSTYGADAGPLYAQLNSLPADVIAVDCAGRPGMCDAIADTGAGKILALGIVDGRSAAREDARVIRCRMRGGAQDVIRRPFGPHTGRLRCLARRFSPPEAHGIASTLSATRAGGGRGAVRSASRRISFAIRSVSRRFASSAQSSATPRSHSCSTATVI